MFSSLFEWFVRLWERRERGAFDPVSIIAGVTIIGLMSGAAYAYWPAMYAQGNVTSCEQNLDAISEAAEMYFAWARAYPATGVVDGGMFLYKGQVNLLRTHSGGQGPVDPADPTGTAHYTFTNSSANGLSSYIVSCPGTHSAMSLQGLPGWKSTSTTIYRSGGQDYTQ